MAYQIDFTASNYVIRSRRKGFLRFLLLAALVGLAWGAYDCYKVYNLPTLNMKLANYEAVAYPIEDMNAAWDAAAKEYGAMVRYYRLVWAANPTNFLSAMASDAAPRLDRGLRPVSWSLKTGGDCVLTYRYTFGPGDKAHQAEGLEGRIAQMVTSVVAVVDGRVDVQGVQHENLLNVDGFNVAARYAVTNARSFPTKEVTLAACVEEIGAMRRTVQELKLRNTGADKGSKPALQANEIMMQYLQKGRNKPGFPDMKNVIDVAGWFGRADSFVRQNGIPVEPEEKRKQRFLRETWNEIGEARFPWERYRALDNETLVASTKTLGEVARGVTPFKAFLERRRADCRKKLEPFIEAYRAEDVFNNPILVPDLRDRAARAAGIAQASVPTPKRADEIASDPSVLDKEDERFTFTWVKWKLLLGAGVGREDGRNGPGEGNAGADPLTLAKVADCVRRVLTLGPGYALDRIWIDFGADGSVSGAVLEGLLPVKKVVKKEAVNVR